MAASAGPAVKAGAKGAQSNILTRKLGPLPGWAWAAVGLGGIYLWRKHNAKASAATATPTASLPISSSSAPSGYGYQGPGSGPGSLGPVPLGATAATGGTPFVTSASAPLQPFSSLPFVSATQANANPSLIGGNQPGTTVPNYGVLSASDATGLGYAAAPLAGSAFYANKPAYMDNATWLAI